MTTACRVCGEPFTDDLVTCPICLQLREKRALRLPSRRAILGCVVLPLLFMGSCAAFVPLGFHILDPMTNRPLEGPWNPPFRVVVIKDGVPRVQFFDLARGAPALPAGASYLIPVGEEDEVVHRLNEKLPAGSEGGWVLDVEQLTPYRQHIELYWMSDGFWGSGYEATATSVTPRYRKRTGPGFGMFAGGLAIVMNLALWLPGAYLYSRLCRRKKSSSSSIGPSSARTSNG